MASDELPSYRAMVLHEYLSDTSGFINRINQLLYTTPNLDLTLGTASYTLSLLSAILPSPSSPIIITSKAPPPTLTRFTSALPPLSNLLSETRIVLRLFGLLGIYTSATSASQSQPYESTGENDELPPPDTGLKWIARAQAIASAAFQLLENIAFLGDKNVLGISPRRRSRYWLWCCRAWAASVGLEFARLGREWTLRRHSALFNEDDAFPTKGNSTQKLDWRRREAARKEIMEKWTRQLKVNACYAPMTVHYSLENRLMSEGMLGLLGLLASGLSLRQAWRGTEH